MIAQTEKKPVSKIRIPQYDLLGIDQLDRDDITAVLDLAEYYVVQNRRKSQTHALLKGYVLVNLFLENSTRTRLSFDMAAKRLGADVINMSMDGSSILKGESFTDTLKTINAMRPDIVVIRAKPEGSAVEAAECLDCPVINAGDGMHEHPTQALLDAMTIRQRKGRVEGLKVSIIGDLLHSRVLRSNVLLLRALGAEVCVCGPATLMLPDMARLGVRATTSIDEAVEDADVIMLLRIQLERMRGYFFPSLREYFQQFGMTVARLRRAKRDVIIMHPGPMNRGVEIASEVADGPYSVILEQVANGVAVRMAVLYLLAGARHE